MLLKKFTLFITFFIPFVVGSLLGIDYGSGFSKAVVIGPQSPLEIVLTDDTKRKQVSGVGLKPLNPHNDPLDIERIYGSGTQSFFTRFPSFSALHLKSLLGKTEAPKYFEQLHPGLKIVGNRRGKIEGLQIEMGEKKYPVEELVAMDFNKIISNAESLIHSKSSTDYFTNMGVCVPAWYSQDQRQALMDVVSLSNLPSLAGLVDDGVAVGINYAIRRKQEISNTSVEYFMIYDMGQESTKATLLGISNANNEILNIQMSGYGFQSEVGGDALTAGLTDLIVDKFLEKYGKSITLKNLQKHHKAMAKIIQAAEKAKLVLSANNEAAVSIESLYNDDIDFRTKISRSDFENLVLVQHKDAFVQPVVDALNTSTLFVGQSLTMQNLSSIILTGGSSRVPFVQQSLADYLGESYSGLLSKSVNADEAAVNGLGIRSIQLSNSFNFKQKINVVDRSVFDYSIALNVDKFSHDVETHTVFPVGSNFSSVSTISVPVEKDAIGSSDAYLKLLENNVEQTAYKIKLSQSSLSNKFNVSLCDEAALNITLRLNENRLFEVLKTELVCLNSQSLSLDKTSLNSSNSLTKSSSAFVSFSHYKNLSKQPFTSAEIRKMKKELQEFNDRDTHRELVSKHLNTLEASIYELRSILEEHETDDVLPDNYVDSANQDVADFLEWLDFEVDSSTSIENIEHKFEIIASHKKNIELYLQSINDPLDYTQFQEIFTNCTSYIEHLSRIIINQTEEVNDKIEAFEQYNLSAVDLYYNPDPKMFKVPAALLEKAQLFNQTFDFIRDELMVKLEELLANDGSLLAAKSRTELFEIKNEYSQISEFVPYLLESAKDVHASKIRYMNALYSRRFKQRLRDEEKKRLEKVKQLSLQKNGTLLEDVLGANTVSFSEENEDYVTLTELPTDPTAATSEAESSSIPEHDEL
ncbi:hypothetical protein ACO0QE_002072 [Hanseniaspora vineae]